MYSWEPKGPDPPNATGPTHQQIAGLMIRDYENPLVSLNKAALRLPWIGWVHRDPLSMASYHPHNWADFVVILIFPLVNYHGKKKTWTWIEDVFPVEHGDFPASHVSLPECK